MWKVSLLLLIQLLIGKGVESQNFEDISIYSMTTVVCEVDYDNDIVVTMDFIGNTWEFEGCDDWFEGDICAMTMCDNGTDIVYDDIILSTKYCGWVESWGWDNEENCPLITFDFE